MTAPFHPVPPPYPGEHRTHGSSLSPILVPVAVGAVVAIALGVYGRVHEPTGIAVNLAGFSSAIAAKSWLTAAVFVLVLVQLVSALAMTGRLPAFDSPRVPTLHRWSGRAAVLLSVPVMVHCLYALGFEAGTARVLLHSLLGCLLYGAFVAKMLVLSRPGMPSWALPLFGGVLFAAFAGVWLTSSLWFFATFGLSF